MRTTEWSGKNKPRRNCKKVYLDASNRIVSERVPYRGGRPKKQPKDYIPSEKVQGRRMTDAESQYVNSGVAAWDSLPDSDEIAELLNLPDMKLKESLRIDIDED